MKTSSIARGITCLALVFFASCTPESSTTPTKTPRPTIKINSFPTAITIDDIDIEFSGYKRENEYLTIEICYEPPSKEKWMFDDVTLKIENQEVPATWFSFDSGTGRADGFNCGSLSYPIDSIPDTGKAELSIGQLQTDSDNYDCDKAQKKLDEAKMGIVVTCDLSSFGVDSGFGILEKPQSMSDEEAYELVKDAFSNTIDVAWKFSFTLEKP